jgi:osmotically inducible lipoprotein OsmB
MNRITKIAAGAALASVVALPATQAFAASKTENALIGAAVGALAGTLLSNGDTGAVIAGAAVGGLVGAAADKPHPRYRAGAYRTYRAAPVYRSATPVYRNSYRSDYGYRNDYGYGYRSAPAYPAGYRYGYGY